jgi:WD40 repeat protein/energy-coupling factor transporter ATP-binding protein EcfA2
MELADSISTEPYPGLRSFRKSESDIFFGRDDHLDEMTAKLAKHHFLCITGPSGCGKSSLARTGLMNHLEAGFLPDRGSDWIFCDFKPGDRPIDALFETLAASIVAESSDDPGGEVERREQLRDSLYYQVVTQRRTNDLNKVLASTVKLPNRPIMILVDQFEELFRYAVSDSSAAVDFVEILVRSAAAKGAIYVVITIRTDELEKCSRYPEFTHVINDSQFLTSVLDRYQIQHAIEGPIALFGGGISPEFSTWLLNCLEEELDRLPLMQHALKLLYSEKSSAEQRHDVTIGVDDFIRVFELPPDLDLSSPEGRRALRSSLSDRLTQRYNELPERLKPGARRVFCALTAIESQHRDIRRPQKIEVLASTIGESLEDTCEIVRTFSTGDEAYLRSTPELKQGDIVDVTHECILRLWSPLQDWLVEEKRSADNVTVLAKLAQNWEDSAKTSSIIKRVFAPEVLRGYTRARYQKWFDESRPNSTWAARYLCHIDWTTPEGPANKLLPETIFARVKAFLEASRKHREMTRVAATLAATAPFIAIIAITWVLYKNAVAQAEIVTMKAHQAQGQTDRIITSSLPPEQTRIANLVAAIDALKNGLAGYEAIWASLQKVYEIYRFDAGDKGVQGQIHAADFTADSKSVLAVDLGGRLHQWALGPERKVLREFMIGPRDASGRPAEGRSLRVSPLGDVAAVGFNDGSVVLVDLSSNDSIPATVSIKAAKASSIFGLVFSSDGSLLVSAARAGNITIWERDHSDQAGTLSSKDSLRWRSRDSVNLSSRQAADIWAVDIDRAKRIIAVGLGDGRVCLLWVADLTGVKCNSSGHTKSVKSVRFKPDEAILLSAGNDAKVTIWNVDSSARQLHLWPIPLFQDNAIWELDFNRDGSLIWNVDSSARQLHPWPIPLFQDNAIWDLDFNREGSLLATSSWDGSVRIYQTGTWRLLNTVAADKVRLMGGGGEATGSKEDRFFALRTVRFDPKSTMLVTASVDHTARVWSPLFDRTSRLDLSYRVAAAGTNPVRPIRSVALGPTGDRVAFTDGDAVYLRSSGQDLTPLAPAAEDRPQARGFTRVVMPSEQEVVAAAVAPRLFVWTESSDGKWLSRNILLPGDAITDGRGLAIDQARSLLAVEVRQGQRASILLCPLPGKPHEWTCADTQNSPMERLPLAIDFRQNACGYQALVAIAIAKSQRFVAAGAGPCPIQVFDRQNATAPRPLRVSEDFTLTSLDFSPDEKSLAATSSSGPTPEVQVWNLANDSSRTLNQHFSTVITAARYSPSGQRIISTSYDNTVVVSSADTGKKLITLGYRNSLFALDIASTPRGILLATGSEAGEVNVMRFFEDDKDVISYATSVLRDISQ